MRFGDVDDQEGDLVPIFVVELVEGRNLPPEGRSSVASENQDDGLPRIQGRELNFVALVELGENEVGGDIPLMKRPSPGACPHGFEGQHEVRWRGHAGHDAAEALWRLPHRPPDEPDESDVSDCHDDEDAAKPSFL